MGKIKWMQCLCMACISAASPVDSSVYYAEISPQFFVNLFINLQKKPIVSLAHFTTNLAIFRLVHLHSVLDLRHISTSLLDAITSDRVLALLPVSPPLWQISQRLPPLPCLQ